MDARACSHKDTQTLVLVCNPFSPCKMVRALAALTGVAAAAAQSTTVSLTLGTTTPQHTTASPFLAYNLDTG